MANFGVRIGLLGVGLFLASAAMAGNTSKTVVLTCVLNNSASPLAMTVVACDKSQGVVASCPTSGSCSTSGELSISTGQSKSNQRSANLVGFHNLYTYRKKLDSNLFEIWIRGQSVRK
jgi:hypothetical protein